MKFDLANPVEPNKVITVTRFVSEERKWEYGIRQMLFGVRVSLSQIGGYEYTIDYCAADQPVFAMQLLVTVAKILERYPEDTPPYLIERDFPKFEIKPINKDPHCWEQLQEMAQAETEKQP